MAKRVIVSEAIGAVAEVIFGLILAGGQGVRMGGVDKAQLALAGRRLIDHVSTRLGPQVARLAISANGDPARFPGRTVLPDDPAHREAGPLAGLIAGLGWAEAQGADALVCAPVDVPFLPRDLVARLAGAGPAMARSQGRAHPSVLYLPVATRARIAELFAQGERRLRAAAPDARILDFAGLPDPFTNLNTPDDLIRAEALLRDTS
ncbi:molybdopterin-guanine dinucleotide biosynthesis protein A [Thioclava dalianensis]|uniref:molybdenum cofactor guanylyltransferase MobA n=1 Tax=Thioclava dalianensis TaxID=1185766 RepID=UPI00068A0BF9|nr:molybdenum cofactor guanylyltransferase MobA [Thioclava dalianensis]SFM75916.1 molybdopterin-guanine dinucleotide biosynthesis protein A [Thioclava dalianensis]